VNKPYKNDAMNQKTVYNILLVGFAILMIGWLIEHGPSSLANPQDGTTPPEQDCSPLGVTPTQIHWYEMWDGETRLSVERIDNEAWQLREQSNESINNEAAEGGARIIADFRLCALTQVESGDDLSQYGLTFSPSYVISFGVDMDNSSEEQAFTLYIGGLNPSQQDYYAIFPDATERQQLHSVDDRIYLLDARYIDLLGDAVFNGIRADTVPLSTDTGTPEAGP
jgi:hypothetical protein